MIPWLEWFIIAVLPFVALALAALAAGMFVSNLPLFMDGKRSNRSDTPKLNDARLRRVSVLIPARNEESSIEACLESVLQSVHVDLEVIVLDDGSTDQTGTIVREIAQHDSRVKLIEGIELPDGWNGKQHACYRLAQHAACEHLLFLDADVRLKPTAIIDLWNRFTVEHEGGETGLLSAFPQQETGTLAEKLLIPMMHFILLSYLPFARMRGSTHPAYASGCGQLFFTTQAAYQAAGTHAAIRSSRHDGLKLPKAYRENGMLTDCVDGSPWAICRMYTSAGEVVQGLLKNADEGIANSRLLIPFTILLGGANVLPWITLAVAFAKRNSLIAEGLPIPTSVVIGILVSGIAILVSYVPRMTGAIRLRQSVTGAILHPIAIVSFLLIQWWAFWNHLRGRQVTWRGRLG
ncbi:glycosyltransferase family 2 protein [Rhodopirellula sp. P2]|uniref:glycosyltransferase family 2 protein n=1 Tax=Rhodopirellula sp. P2 TaxID=2127060 RepID=UPI0023687153|nr:glycosyltransferase family A protein [Rhodopirellula sp. P2]WDQ16903.1 glycosyltransferase family A protein [Rhodopirellula sp. P2]